MDDSYRKPIKHLLSLLSSFSTNKTNDKIKIAYGGGQSGLMKEIFDSSSELETISINCHKWIKEGEDTTFAYDSILDRQNHLLSIADAYIVCPGGVGTAFEFLQALTCNDIKETNKPIYVLNHNNYFMHIFDFLEWARKTGMITKTNEELNLFIADCPEKIIDKMKKTF